MDVHSSSVWGEALSKETKGRKNWQHKYGQTFPDPVDDDGDGQLIMHSSGVFIPGPGMNKTSRPALGPSKLTLRAGRLEMSCTPLPATEKLPVIRSPNRALADRALAGDEAKNGELMALRKKLSNELREVERGLARGRSTSRSRSRPH